MAFVGATAGDEGAAEDRVRFDAGFAAYEDADLSGREIVVLEQARVPVWNEFCALLFDEEAAAGAAPRVNGDSEVDAVAALLGHLAVRIDAECVDHALFTQSGALRSYVVPVSDEPK